MSRSATNGIAVDGAGVAGLRMVCQEGDVLRNADTIIMETHARYIGEQKLHLMMTKLKQLGFKVVEEIGFVVVMQK